MSYFVRVMCRSKAYISCKEIAEFIIEGAHFEIVPDFQPPIAILQDVGDHCSTVSMSIDTMRPVAIFYINRGDNMLQEEIQELLDVIADQPEYIYNLDVVRKIRSSSQVVAIELDTYQLSDDVWEMVDGVSAYIARTYDGIIYIEDRGVFDCDFSRLWGD